MVLMPKDGSDYDRLVLIGSGSDVETTTRTSIMSKNAGILGHSVLLAVEDLPLLIVGLLIMEEQVNEDQRITMTQIMSVFFNLMGVLHKTKKVWEFWTHRCKQLE